MQNSYKCLITDVFEIMLLNISGEISRQTNHYKMLVKCIFLFVLINFLKNVFLQKIHRTKSDPQKIKFFHGREMEIVSLYFSSNSFHTFELCGKNFNFLETLQGIC